MREESASTLPKSTSILKRNGVFLVFCAILSVLLTVGYVVLTDQNTSNNAPTTFSTTVKQRESIEEFKDNGYYGKPNRIVIESVGIDLPIFDGSYNEITQEWSFVEDSAMLIEENLPLSKGHGLVYIYGHNATDIFLPTFDLPDRAIMEIHTNTGHKISYVFEGYHLISEHDSYVLDDVADNTIRLITCKGVGAPHRLLSQFTYLGPSKIDSRSIKPINFL